MTTSHLRANKLPRPNMPRHVNKAGDSPSVNRGDPSLHADEVQAVPQEICMQISPSFIYVRQSAPRLLRNGLEELKEGGDTTSHWPVVPPTTDPPALISAGCIGLISVAWRGPGVKRKTNGGHFGSAGPSTEEFAGG
ncbi:hypothetical protein Bbelb_296650 [Branchiostoma belcheri]|nr:hypothetical protein Bbelb_296650 [Branchiostoma belcheri]